MKTTINGKLRGVAVALLSMLIPATVTAQDKFEISLGAEVVSKYVWRGFDQASGTSVQPSLGLAYKEYPYQPGEVPVSQTSNPKNSISRWHMALVDSALQ